MSGHTVRVELHEGTDEDYAKLHKAMEALGFTRTIEKRGTTYELPAGEYNFMDTGRTTKSVRALAKGAASKIGLTAAILVTTGKRRFTGLKKAR